MAAMRSELRLAVDEVAGRLGEAPAADTVFIGGGTPSLLGATGLTEVLDAVRGTFGLRPDAEVTTEANPESTSAAFFDGIRAAGYTRVSLGMQSAAEHVLKILDRTHTPGRAAAAAAEAKAAGFEHVNLDLIYGTPGERLEDLDRSLDAVLAAGADHVSAYSLIVEDGTALARRVRRGELPAPDDDVLADRYARVDKVLESAGLHWYEVSNWATDADAECRHNLGYWAGGNWWGAGPGAHGHLDGVRWWNVKHPARYAQTLAEGELPIAGHEVLTASERHIEAVMLAARLRSGLPVDLLDSDELDRAEQVVASGLLVRTADGFTLTDRGRYLADGVVRDVLG